MNVDKYYAPVFRVGVDGQSLPLDVTTAIKQVVLDDKQEGADTFSLSIDNHDLRWLNAKADVFAEGNEVSITLGYAGGAETSMLGEITSLQAAFPSSGSPSLTVTGLDLSHRLMKGQKRRTFKKMTDSDIAAQLANEAGLSSDVTKTQPKLDYVVQENLTDYQFLKNRAKRIGFDIWVKDRTLYFHDPANQSGDPIKLKWGKSLIDFTPRLTLANQVAEVEIRGWDPVTKKEFIGTAKWKNIKKSGLSKRAVQMLKANTGGASKKVEIDRAVHSQKQADEMAKAILKNITDTLITGTGNCIGMPSLRVGKIIKLEGMGPRFSGSYIVTGTTHTLGGAGYKTKFEVRKRIQ